MRKPSFKILMISVVAIAIAAFTACQEEYVIEEIAPTKSGNLLIRLTDAPFPTDLVAEASVTINKIEIHKMDDEQGPPFIVFSEEEQSFNLLDLTNGVTAILADTAIESGFYKEIRLQVVDAYVKLKDSTLFDLKIPSGAQSGLKVKINPSIEVDSALNAELLLDFDVSKSFVVQGNPNTPAGIKGFNFNPVVKATIANAAGKLKGTVTDANDNAIEGAQVSIIAADTVYTSSFTKENGKYVILGIDAGVYEVEFAKDGYAATTIEDVEIKAKETTTLDAQLDSE
ncbi:DUF4382 domain-containing protein [Maribellus mangrovi]|uniref:DUF4382 domain-containing protein n=1 Tax=Maribellus mangrovi TaxID=3133146 RepID=UPI0030EF0E88